MYSALCVGEVLLSTFLLEILSHTSDSRQLLSCVPEEAAGCRDDLLPGKSQLLFCSVSAHPGQSSHHTQASGE